MENELSKMRIKNNFFILVDLRGGRERTYNVLYPAFGLPKIKYIKIYYILTIRLQPSIKLK